MRVVAHTHTHTRSPRRLGARRLGARRMDRPRAIRDSFAAFDRPPGATPMPTLRSASVQRESPHKKYSHLSIDFSPCLAYPVGMKHCPRCKQDLNNESFYQNGNAKLSSYCKVCQRELQAKWDSKHRARKLAINREWYRRNRVRKRITTRAHLAVMQAIAKGVLVRPSVCSKCAQLNTKIEASHSSYEKADWLNVQWLCPKCHRLLDAENPKSLGANTAP